MVIRVKKHIKDLVAIFWEAIKHRRVLAFDFESASGNIGVREIRPYMIFINEKEETKVVGLPRRLWNKTDKEKQPRQYLLDKINLKQVKIYSQIFDDPGVPRDIVVTTKRVKIICRFVYDDEDVQEVMKTWAKIDGLDLR